MQRAHKRYAHKNMPHYFVNLEVAGPCTGSVSCNLKYRLTKWLWLIFNFYHGWIYRFLVHSCLNCFFLVFPSFFLLLFSVFLCSSAFLNMIFCLRNPISEVVTHTLALYTCIYWEESSGFPLRTLGASQGNAGDTLSCSHLNWEQSKFHMLHKVHDELEK